MRKVFLLWKLKKTFKSFPNKDILIAILAGIKFPKISNANICVCYRSFHIAKISFCKSNVDFDIVTFEMQPRNAYNTPNWLKFSQKFMHQWKNNFVRVRNDDYEVKEYEQMDLIYHGTTISHDFCEKNIYQ